MLDGSPDNDISKRVNPAITNRPPLALAIFASGGGSNFEAICRAVDEGKLNARVALCLSDRDSAGVLELARRRGIVTTVIRPGPDEESTAATILAALDNSSADFVALAGYLKRIPPAVVAAFENRIINVHPSLLPAFGGKGMYGRRVHEAVLAAGARVSGATIHLVDNNYDTGPIVLQRCVAVDPTDDAQSLAARVLKIEHALYPEALQLFASGRIRVDNRRVLIADERGA